MEREFKTIEQLTNENKKLVEVELMLTPLELQSFANYCKQNDLKFNDWIRKLSYDKLKS